MKFSPYPGRIHFETMKATGVLKSVDGDVIESGRVIAVGKWPWYLFWKRSWFQPGDVVHFLRWGAEETPTGEWVVREDVAFIMGKSYEE